MFIELLKAAIIGIVEGITEWLPISSTGHMILVEEFVKINASYRIYGNVPCSDSTGGYYGRSHSLLS